MNNLIRSSRASGQALVLVVAVCLGGLGSALPAWAQAPADVTVAEVRFEGLVRTSATYATSVVKVRAGDPLVPAELEADVNRLLAAGRFAAASYRTEPGEGGVAVVFTVEERPTVAAVRFEGNVKFKADKLAKEVPLKEGDPVDVFKAREGADAILAKYREEAYGEARVTFDDALLRESGELVYTVEEGPRIRVRKISFEGNEHFRPAELQKHVSTKTYLWLLRDGKFEEEAAESDAAAVQAFLRGEGYLDAQVSYRVEAGATPEDLQLVFTIAEGTRYLIEAITFTGHAAFAEEELRSLVTLQPQEPIRQPQLEKDVRAIRDKYTENGYIYAEVRAVRVFSETSGFVLVTLEIQEGEQFRVGRIVVRGNERTKDKVARRAFDLYPEDVFNLGKAKEAETTLRQTQIFSTATVTPVGEQSGVRDVLINVEESRKAGDFVFGFGVTSNSGLVGSIVLDIKNFDLFDVPRSPAEFFKLRSFHGAGQRLRIEAQPGTEMNRFRIDFTEPYLLDKPLRLDWGAYYFDRERDEYDEQRVGSTVSLGKRLTRGLLKDWYAEVAFRVENVEIDDTDWLTAEDIREDEGSHFLTSVKGTLVRDRTDNRFLPTRGDRLRVSYEQFGALGGEYSFGKVAAAYDWHKTLYTDVQERKSVLSLKSDVGYVVGDAPVFERYYAGGIGSLRGFEFRTISPRQGFRHDAIGGDFMALFSAEYSFPLYAEVLRGLFFTDMGTVEPGFEINDWRVAIGAGVRLQIDFFGPVPLEFAIAAPVSRNDRDEEQVFSFMVGATF